MDRCETRRIYESGGKYFKIWSRGGGRGGVHREVLRSAEIERARACERMREGCGREHAERRKTRELVRAEFCLGLLMASRGRCEMHNFLHFQARVRTMNRKKQ